MGYEVKLFVGEVSTSDVLQENGHKYMSVVSMIELCKPGYDAQIVDLMQRVGTPVYLYPPAGDGDKSVTEDCYGHKLQAYPIRTVIDALAKDLKKSRSDYSPHGYRRFYIAQRMLRAIQRTFPNSDYQKTMVVFYGH